MKAHLPFQYVRSRKGRSQAAAADALLLFAYAIRATGGSSAFINRWFARVGTTMRELAEDKGNIFSNREWGDQVDYWAEQHDIKLPEPYRLLVKGGSVVDGLIPARLVLMELFTLTLLGYGDVRMRRVFDKYVEISNLYGDGIAKFTRQELYAWADGANIYYK